MKIVDDALLLDFRLTFRCEVCKKARDVDPHHVFSRGSGRLDIAINLISLCRGCHNLTHAGKVKREQILAIVARREGWTPEDIEIEIWRLRRLPKG